MFSIINDIRNLVVNFSDLILFYLALLLWLLLGLVFIVGSIFFLDIFELVTDTKISNLVQWVTSNVVGFVSEQKDQGKILLLKRQILEVLVIVEPIVVALAGPLTYFVMLRNIKRQQPIKSKRIRLKGDDLKVMAHHYKRAEEVYVFSGDFSWVSEGKNKALIDSVIRLADDEKIKFFSYKDEARVAQAFEHSGKLNLFHQLKPLFTFNTSTRIKGSLIRTQSQPVFIYRNDESHLRDGSSTINTLTGHNQARYLVTIINELCEQVLTKSPNNGEYGGHRVHGYIIVGLFGSGKSTAARFLSSNGFHVVSAGDIFREICKAEGLPETRKALQDRGNKLLEEEGVEGFIERILAPVANHRFIVIEGIRSVETVIKLRKTHSSLRTLFIETSDAVRKERLFKNRILSDSDFKKLMQQPLETEIEQVRYIADNIINNDGTFDKLYEILCKDLCCTLTKKLIGQYPI